MACVPLGTGSSPPPASDADVTPTPIVVVARPTALPQELVEEATAEDLLLINLYERVNPAVVNIQVLTSAPSPLGDDLFPEGEGSGFIIDKEGHVVTNNHVVEGAEEVQVTLYDGSMVVARGGCLPLGMP